MLNFEKIKLINWFVVSVIFFIFLISLVTLYSAAGGNVYPWVIKQLMRFVFGFFLMIGVAVSDIRWWFSNSYLFYAVSLILLLIVEFIGFVGMGAQRWVDLYFFNLQPSELMRVFLVMALARYLALLNDQEVNQNKNLIVPVMMVLIPIILVLKQPDLGTAIILLSSAFVVFFMCSIDSKKFFYTIISGLLIIPIMWNFLHDYQKKRILIFIDPESDPSNAGYHIKQSKIALGAGGGFGKGWMQGTQNQLDFLPEKQTDFIFTMFCEEFGLLGAIILLIFFSMIIFYGIEVAINCRNYFGKLLVVGLTTTFFLYVFINMAMVMGMLPIVGVPLPFMSYGGTAMMTLLISQGLIFAVDIHNKRHKNFM